MSFSVVKYWKFAIECVVNPLKERNERETWTFILKRSRDNVKYVSAYMQKLAKTSISSEDLVKQNLSDHLLIVDVCFVSIQDLLDTLETDLSLDELVILRRIAYARIKKEDALAKVQRTVFYCCFFYSFYRAVEFKSRAFFRVGFLPGPAGNHKSKRSKRRMKRRYLVKKKGPLNGGLSHCPYL